jgi:hypothetical protein
MKESKVDLQEWARITIQRWVMRMGKIGFGPTSTGALINSFDSLVPFLTNEAQGDTAKVTFAFLFYGYYWDAGVGKGYTRGNPGDLQSLNPWNGGAGHRKKHRWFNKIFWNEVNNLSRLMARQYGDEAVKEMVQSFERHKI